MNVLVTGAAGFIGSYLIERLYRDGHMIIATDRFSRGIPEKKPYSKSQVRYIRADVTKYGSLRELESVRFDWVFHLAGASGNKPSISDPVKYHEINVSGTMNILELCRLNKAGKLVYAASSSCYGNVGDRIVPEYAPVNPGTPYALTKYLGEQYVLHWGKVYGIPVVSLRLFVVYGPKSCVTGTYGSVVTTFMDQREKNGFASVNGDGNQRKDFVWVKDVVNAMILAASMPPVQPVYNVGTGMMTSLNQLTSLLRLPVKYSIKPHGGQEQSAGADIRAINRDLHWKPTVDLEQGIRQILTV